MPGTVYLTAEPQALLDTYLEGRTLVSPHGLAALTYGRSACNLEDLLRQADVTLVTDTQALTLITGILTQDDWGDLPLQADMSLLEDVRTLLATDALDTLPVGSDHRTSQLIRLSKAYQKALQEAGQQDSACTVPFSRTVLLVRQPLLLSGYVSLPPALLACFDRLSDASSVVVLPKIPNDPRPSALLTQLIDLGWQEGICSATNSLRQIKAVQVPDRLHEARFALDTAIQFIHQGIAPHRIVLTARELDDYRTPLHLAARERQLLLQWPGQETYGATPDGVFLQLLGHVLTSHWDYERVCALLTSPVIPELTQAHWKRIRQAGASTQASWSTPGLLPEPLGVLSKLPLEGELHLWYELLRELPIATALLYELTPVLERFLPSAGPHSQQLYGTALLTALQRPIPAALALDGHRITIIPADWLPSIQSEVTIALGLSEGIWPGVPRFSVLLDAHERARLSHAGLSLPTAATIVLHETALFWWAEHSANTAFIATTPSLIGMSLRPPSMLLKNMYIEPAPPYVPTWMEPSSVTLLEPFDFPQPLFDLVDIDVSPTQLTRFGQCPFRWFSQHGLRLHDIEEPRSTLSPHVRGRLYHQTLDYVAKGLQSNQAADLDALVHEGFIAAEEIEHPDRLTNWAMQRAEHIDHLLSLVHAPDFLPDGHIIYASERDFTLSWHGLTVSGTLDRLDQTEAGFEVIDYKTGSSKPKGARDDAGKLTLDVQLSIYLAAATEITGIPVSTGRYLSLTRRERWTPTVPNAPALEELATTLIRSLETGPFPVLPDDAQEACRFCDQRMLCRHTATGEASHAE